MFSSFSREQGFFIDFFLYCKSSMRPSLNKPPLQLVPTLEQEIVNKRQPIKRPPPPNILLYQMLAGIYQVLIVKCILLVDYKS